MDARIERVWTPLVGEQDESPDTEETNSWIIGDDEEAIVIDPGEDASTVLDVVGEREVIAVICTHGHAAHVKAALEVAVRDEAPVALHPSDKVSWRTVIDGEDPEIEMAQDGRFEVADVTLEVMHTPGHSPGSVSLYCPELAAVFTGDALLAGGPAPHDRAFPDFPAQLSSIGEFLLDLPAETRVLPGHGEETTIGAASKRFDSWVTAGPGERDLAGPNQPGPPGLGEPGPIREGRTREVHVQQLPSGGTTPRTPRSPRGTSDGKATAPDVQLGFEGMPRRLYSCTPTRLATWLDCPRRYRMSYLDRPVPPKGPPWAHNSLGASVHNALAAWWRLPLARRTPDAAGSLLARGWVGEGFADDEQSARYRDWARRIVEGYTATLDPADEPVGVERTVATRTDLIAVSGRIDRLDTREAPGGGTELVVVDYKTGRHVLTTDDARSSMALALYAIAAARSLRRDCTRVELHHLPTGAVIAWEHTADTLARHLRRAEETAAECADADDKMRAGLPRQGWDEVFPPRPGPLCGWCDFLRHCDQGQVAATRHRPWDGLAEI